MKFYVYELVVVPDGNVCYVGKGSNGRMYVHRKNLNCHSWSQLGLYRRLRELIESGKDFKPVKVFETDSEEEAFQEESRRIEQYGFNNLFNSTNHRCRRASDVDIAMRQAMSKAQREKAEYNRKLYGSGLHPDHCAAIGNAHRGRKRPDASAWLKQAHADGKFPKKAETMARLNRSRTGKQLNPEHVQKLVEAHTGTKLSNETKLRISLARKKFYEDPENRAKMSEIAKKREELKRIT